MGQAGSSVQAQKDVLRLVSLTGSPWMLLNHCRSVSTSDTIAMGTWKMLHSCARAPARARQPQARPCWAHSAVKHAWGTMRLRTIFPRQNKQGQDCWAGRCSFTL